jgi:hypothetical protein
MDKLKGAAESVQAQTSKVGIGANADQMSLANLGKKLMDKGIEQPAHIDSMESTGATDTPGGTEHIINVTVAPNGGDAYQATFNQYIYPNYAAFETGQDVLVRIDPDNPQAMMLWGQR